MIRNILPAVLLAACAIAGAAPGSYAAAGLFAVLYLLFSFLPLKPEAKLVLLAAVGFPLILAAGYAVTAGLTSALLLISLLSFAETLSRTTAVLSILSGAAAFLCALQSSVLPAVVIAAVIAAAGVYALFIFEYRIRKQLKVNPHEQK